MQINKYWKFNLINSIFKWFWLNFINLGNSIAIQLEISGEFRTSQSGRRRPARDDGTRTLPRIRRLPRRHQQKRRRRQSALGPRTRQRLVQQRKQRRREPLDFPAFINCGVETAQSRTDGQRRRRRDADAARWLGVAARPRRSGEQFDAAGGGAAGCWRTEGCGVVIGGVGGVQWTDAGRINRSERREFEQYIAGLSNYFGSSRTSLSSSRSYGNSIHLNSFNFWFIR